MTYEFRDGVRKDGRLLILLAGGTGSGKTESAMRVATGLADGEPFAVIDTENGRALHKADEYKFKHTELQEPFTPERYTEVVKAADDLGFPVIVVDSGSHEYEGIGGVLDIQAEEFDRMGNRESSRMSSWIKPKQRHKRFVQQLLRSRAHVILCLRAEDKIEIVKEGDRTVVRPRESLVGAHGWIPICEKRLPFEATISLLLLQSNPGVPVPVKLEKRHRELVSLDEKLSEETGRLLGQWAKGSGDPPEPTPKTSKQAKAKDEPKVEAPDAELLAEADTLARTLVELATKLGATETLPSIESHRAQGHVDWLQRAITAAAKTLDERKQEEQQENNDRPESLFKAPEGALER